MDKIINNGYQCSLNGMTDDTALVTVIEGNDVTLDIQLTKYDVDEEIWKSYSLLGYDDVQCYLLTPNGTHIDLDTEVQLDGKVKAKAESYQLETNMTYGIGVDWKDDDNDLSVKAKGMVKVVRYSEVTEDYDITVTDNATYISLGQLPEDYITPDELTVVLGDYVTNSSLSSTLEGYVEDSELENYITDTDLSTVLDDYVSDNELSSTLQDYVSDSDLTTALNPYVTETELGTALNPYVTETELGTTLQPYVTSTDLSSTLADYVTIIDNENQNEAISKSLVSIDDRVTTLEQSGGGTGDVTMSDLDNYLEATAAALVEQESQIESLHDNFDNYVTIEDNEDQNEAISNSLVSLNSRVTTLEQNPSVPSNVVVMSDLDNYLEATAAALTDHEDQIDSLALSVGSINSNFSNYVTITDNENQNEAISNTLVSLDSRVTTIEQNPPVPSNVVTSNDADNIVLLTQSQYDDLVNNNTVDPDALYYITDTTSDYVTDSEMIAAINTAISGITIPTVNNATLTIQKNSNTVSTFTANASSNVTCNITVPTDTNDLTNGANFVSSTSITTIVQISQSDYDNLVNGGTVDANTMYVIV